MAWAMIAFLSLSKMLNPQMVQIDFASREACLSAGKQFAESMIAIGFCVDKQSGDTSVWMSGAAGSPRPDQKEN